MKILFHFAKTNDKFNEWIEFGSPRIFAFNSKVVHVKKERKPKKASKELSAEKQLSVAAATISKAVLAQTQPQRTHVYGSEIEDGPDMSLQQVSEASDAHESQQMDAPVVSEPMKVDSSESDLSVAISFDQLTRSYGKETICRNVAVEREPKRKESAGPVSSQWQTSDAEPSYRVHRPFVEASRSSASRLDDGLASESTPLGSFVSMDRTTSSNGNSMPTSHEKYLSHQRGNGYASHAFGAAAFQPSPAPSRPPDFVSARSGTGSQHHTSSLLNRRGFLTASPASVPSSVAPSAFGLSGLDMLAAVTNQHAFGTSMNELSNTGNMSPNIDNFAVQPNGLGHSSFMRSDTTQAGALLQQRYGLQQQQQQQPPSFSQNQSNSNSPFSNHQYGW